MKFKLKVLGALHIGSGEEIEVWDFYIKDNELYLIDRDLLLRKYISSDIDTRNKILQLCLSNKKPIEKILELRRVYQEKLDKLNIESTGLIKQKLKIPNRIENYINDRFNKKSDDKTLNRLQILSFVKTNYKPYVPGASIKGALWTAIFDKVVPQEVKEKTKQIVNKPYFSYEDLKTTRRLLSSLDNKLKRELFGDNINKYMHLLNVSDSSPFSITHITFAKNCKKDYLKNNKPISQGVNVLLEVAKDEEIEVEITIDKELYSFIGRRLKEDFFVIINNFYRNIFEEERNLYSRDFVNKVRNHLNPNTILLRMGRYSGAKSLTITDRAILIRKGKKKEYHRDSSTIFVSCNKEKNITREDTIPFGWCLLKRIE